MQGNRAMVTQQHRWQKVVQQDGSTLFISPEGLQWTETMMAATARVKLTPLGYDISKAIQSIPEEWGKKGIKAKILAKIVMPEHIHFILFIEEPMEERLQRLIRGWKQGCNKLLRKYLEGGGGAASGHCEEGGWSADVKNAAQPNGRGEESAPELAEAIGRGEKGAPELAEAGLCCGKKPEELPFGSAAFLRSAIPEAIGRGEKGAPELAEAGLCCGKKPEELPFGSAAFLRSAIPPFLRSASARIIEEHALFEEDFDETRLRRKGQLRAMIDYVHNNPAHRWLRSHKPHWLLPIRGIEIAGRRYDAIGNILLLGLPRFQVHCRNSWERNQDKEARRAHQNDSVMKARLGYALVSPFISPHEAAVRDFCLQEGHSIIQLTDNGFSDFSQCPSGLYDYCDRGQVLILVPSELPHIDRKDVISRAECKALNDRAEEIAGEL